MGQWLTTVYLLMVGVVSALTATLFQRVRTRRLLECSLALFAAECLAAIVAPSFWTLLVARAIQAATALSASGSLDIVGFRAAGAFSAVAVVAALVVWCAGALRVESGSTGSA